MKIYVRVKEKSQHNKIEDYGNWRYMLYTDYGLDDPQINQIVVSAMAKHLTVPTGRFVLVSGLKDKDKVFEVN